MLFILCLVLILIDIKNVWFYGAIPLQCSNFRENSGYLVVKHKKKCWLPRLFFTSITKSNRILWGVTLWKYFSDIFAAHFDVVRDSLWLNFNEFNYGTFYISPNLFLFFPPSLSLSLSSRRKS